MSPTLPVRLLCAPAALILLNSCAIPPDEPPAQAPADQVELQARAAVVAAHECATGEPTPAERRRIKEDVDRRRALVAAAKDRTGRRQTAERGGRGAGAGTVSALAALPGMTVPVYVHNIKRSGGTDRVVDGHITSSTVDTAISRLNTAFSSAGITFVKRSVKAHVRPEWFEIIGLSESEPTPAEIAMKQALREGGPNTLNIYTRGGGALVSSALFPWKYWERPWRDGVSIHVDSFPRTGVDGDVIVHEVGHWLGLWHSFYNGCNAPGDEVDDTPYVRSSNSSSDSGARQCTLNVRDSCPGDGPDMIDNYMDYSPPACENVRARFTQGQIDRMVEMQEIYRLNFESHLLSTTTDGRLWHAMNAFGWWSNLGDVKAVAGQIGSVTRTDGQGVDGVLHTVALVGTDLFHSVRKEWAWTPLSTFGAGAVKAAGLGRHNGDLHVCFVRTDNSLRHIIRRADGTWSSITDVKSSAGGTDPSGTMLSADCGLLGSDMHYVTTNSSGQVHWTKRSSGGSWSSWRLLTTQSGAKDADVEQGNGELHLVVTRPADQLHVRLTSSGSFTGSLVNVEGAGGAGEIGGTTDNSTAMGDQFGLFVGQSNSSRLMETQRDPSGSWWGYLDLRDQINNGRSVGTFNWIAFSSSGVYR